MLGIVLSALCGLPTQEIEVICKVHMVLTHLPSTRTICEGHGTWLAI